MSRWPLQNPKRQVWAAALLFCGATIASQLVPDLRSMPMVGVGCAIFAFGALLALRNVTTHEGWELVLAGDAIEIPKPPIQGTRRKRILYQTVHTVRVLPPTEDPLMVVQDTTGNMLILLWQHQLVNGKIEDLAVQLMDRCGIQPNWGAEGNKS